jgi:1-acyl-sn-glycerol-3-phosphate acyltransferase
MTNPPNASAGRLALELLQAGGLEALRRYFRLRLRGDQYLPAQGPAVIVANHSGAFGLDALLLRHEVSRVTGRDARVLAHRAWFSAKHISADLTDWLGLVEATLPAALTILRAGHMLIVFPEAEDGNFKASLDAYKLRAFRPGFVRMAAAARAPIVPVAVRGAEEATITLASLPMPRGALMRRLPLPLNLLPLPSRWEFRFLPSLEPPQIADGHTRGDLEGSAERIRARIQGALP